MALYHKHTKENKLKTQHYLFVGAGLVHNVRLIQGRATKRYYSVTETSIVYIRCSTGTWENTYGPLLDRWNKLLSLILMQRLTTNRHYSVVQPSIYGVTRGHSMYQVRSSEFDTDTNTAMGYWPHVRSGLTQDVTLIQKNRKLYRGREGSPRLCQIL